MSKLLENINIPADIRGFNSEQLRTLCAEIREYMIDCCSKNPGHLGSSLGAVELIVGLHYVYNTPHDNIVFDVGHQAYAHKIITRRKEAFRNLRCANGISGFPKRSESEYDVFGSGHSSTSISAALGLAQASQLSGAKNKTVAIIGDGALSGGLAFEGLNNAGASKSDILVIVNDNDMSIDKNTGGIHDYLLQITTHPKYNRIKNGLWRHIGDSQFRNAIQKTVVSVKSHLVKKTGGDLFESLGFRYFGPIDGNNVEQVVEILSRLRQIPGPKILHCITRKGAGYAPAEEDQTTWHAPGKFDPQTGKRLVSSSKVSRYQDVFGEVLLELARANDKIVGVTPAMASGCGMNVLSKEMPSRFFDVGIAEEHAVTFSAGLAAGGMKPFCNIYSSFSQRAYDQIIHDVALQNLGVVLCFDRGGLVGEDGSTHHGIFDMAAYRSIPNAIIAVPRNEIELKNMMYTASLCPTGPFIIRYPRGNGEGIAWREAAFEKLTIGQSECLLEGSRVAIIAAGPFANRAYEAAQEYAAKNGVGPAVYNIRYVKPIDVQLLDYVAEHFDKVITIEDGCVKGGLYGAVTEYFAPMEKKVMVRAIGVPDEFVEQGSQVEQRKECELDAQGILRVVSQMM